MPLLPEQLEAQIGRPDQGLGDNRGPPDAPAPREVREALAEPQLGRDDRGLERRNAVTVGGNGSGHGGILRRPHAQRPDVSSVTVSPGRTVRCPRPDRPHVPGIARLPPAAGD